MRSIFFPSIVSFTLSAFCATALLGQPAGADSIKLKAPLRGASLHDHGVDMNVYYVGEGEAFEVVATYAPRSATGAERDAARRFRMALRDNDAVSFGIPGRPGVLYRFARNGGTVSVETVPVTWSAPLGPDVVKRPF